MLKLIPIHPLFSSCPLPLFPLGNSTKFTAKSPASAMEWVVAIKEAIRVEEERERAEVSPSTST